MLEITEELIDQLYENEKAFGPMYDVKYGDDLPREAEGLRMEF